MNTREVALGLLDLTMVENRQVSDQMAEQFVEIAQRIGILCQQLENIQTDDPAFLARKLQIETLRQMINHNIELIQFGDITNQRLTHIETALSSDTADVASILTEERETLLMGLLEKGESLDAALALTRSAETKAGSVELF